MASLQNVDSDEIITNHVSLKEKQEVIRSTQTLLSGEVYIQRIGSPSVNYEVVAYVNYEGKSQLLLAEDMASLLEISVNHGTYRGRITKMSFGERLPCNYFKADLTLAKEPEEVI